jgi:hypothetical protein
MTVHLVRWSGTPEPGGGRDVLAFVDDTRVIVKRRTNGVTWTCAEHGQAETQDLCGHTAALAATPAHPERNRP